MKILITGAYGQLGNELKALSVHYPHWQFQFTDVDSLDIAKEQSVRNYFREMKPDFVVNCAAYTAVDKAETDVENAKLINTVAPGFLAKAAKATKAGFIHISTDYVFNGRGFTPYSETDEVIPLGVYGKTKREGEVRCIQNYESSIIIRTSWLYSSYGHNFLKTMLRLGKERDFLKVVYDQVGTPTYAEDLAKAVFIIIETWKTNPAACMPGIYHYSNEGVASWYDFAKAIFETAGIACKIIPVLSKEFSTHAQRPHYSVLNKSKIKTTFNLEIPYWKDSLKNGIKKLQKI